MTHVTRVDGLKTTEVSDGEIISTADGTTHYLNSMATLIYELADGRDSASIARSLATVFDLSQDHAQGLVDQSLAEMRTKGLVN